MTPDDLDGRALKLARDAYGRKYADMSGPHPTEEPNAGGGPLGYAIRAYLKATTPAPVPHVEPVAFISTSTLAQLNGHGGLYLMASPKWPHEEETVPLYTHPPAPETQTLGWQDEYAALSEEQKVLLQQLADHFGVSLIAAFYRAKELGQLEPPAPQTRAELDETDGNST